MGEWQEATISAIADLALSSLDPSQLGDELVEYFSIPAYDAGSPQLVSCSQIHSNKFLVPEGSVLVSRINPHIPRVWLVDEASSRLRLCSTEFVPLRPRQPISPDFLYQVCRSPTFLNKLRELVTGTTGSHQRVDRTALLNIRVLLPPLSEQRAIAEILGALDDKIEANRRVARALEQRLSAMFLQFGFDELSDSDDDEVVTLSEILDVNPPRTRVTLDVAPYIDMAALPTDSALVTKPAFRQPKSGTRFINKDTLMARITPCLENGKVAFVDCLANNEVGTGSTEFLVLRPREPLPAQFAYFLARSRRFSAYAIQHMSGSSGRQRCSAEAIERYELAQPKSSDLIQFRELADPSFAMMRGMVNESARLADLRDALLPKLMSGEIRVRDAERIVEDAV